MNWWVGRRLRCWVGEYWTAVWEKGETTAALLARLLAGREMDDGGETTAALLDERDGTTATLLGWREVDDGCAATVGGEDTWLGESST